MLGNSDVAKIRERRKHLLANFDSIRVASIKLIVYFSCLPPPTCPAMPTRDKIRRGGRASVVNSELRISITRRNIAPIISAASENANFFLISPQTYSVSTDRSPPKTYLKCNSQNFERGLHFCRAAFSTLTFRPVC